MMMFLSWLTVILTGLVLTGLAHFVTSQSDEFLWGFIFGVFLVQILHRITRGYWFNGRDA
jgi:hypothetical protein